MTTTPVLSLSGAQLRRNIDAVSAHIAPSRLMLVMKDDAYNQGLDWVLGEAGAVSWFGGYDIRTSLRIKEQRPDARVFAWATSSDDEIADAIAGDLDLGVGTLEYLRRVIDQAQSASRVVRVHLKIDSGLHRNGVRPEDWPEFVDVAVGAQRSGQLAVVGVWSHLGEASDADDDDSAEIFHTAAAALRDAGAQLEVEHLTASAASWWREELRGSLCRIGAFCYGIRSGDGPEIPGVAPIATLTAEVVAVTAEGVEVGIGSLHGLPSTLVGTAIATSAGLRRITAVGPHTSTVEEWPDAAPGDVVWIFGPGEHGEPDATALGERIDSIGEEILLRLSPRVRRVVAD